jgi:outer membrane lipoprotein carrier protein
MTRTVPRFLTAILVVIVTSVALSCAPASAAGMNPLEGLELVRNRFAGMTDFTAEITQEKQIALLRRTMTSSGQVRFKRPDMFYMEVYSPDPSRLLLKDNVVTMVLPADGIRQKTVLPGDEGLSHWFKLLDRPLTRLPDSIDVRAERNDGTLTLWIDPKEKKGVKEIRLTLLEDGRPKKLVIEEQNHDRTVINFRRVRKNVGLTADDFRME